ncbi:phage tail assembly chaperone [Sphingopyxis sp. GW247-27LB]|uniref:phage tail assembly chaperone n=1 Tax=Sphingopyxis sp. GW247-27LB TaxID=2012632 RepID=UPI000BA79C90|nr:phage tail assembly chaperone [Sphingopyxis sp. GW247-27LB]PAL25464.1 hypothetical protein CD928_03045 [Sphingopyxis sp. GW247-27LB]
MDQYFSPSTGGFYNETIHGPRQIAEPLSEKQIKAGRTPRYVANSETKIPLDAVAVSQAEWARLMEAQEKGQQIVVEAGRAKAVDPDPLAPADQLAIIRTRRNRLLAATDVMLAVPDYPISAEQREELIAWRAALRDLTATIDQAAPLDSVEWPARPSWLGERGELL